MDNPYKPPEGRLPSARTTGFKLPSWRAFLFVVTLTCLSFATHWWPRQVHGLLRIGPTLIGYTVEAALLATWGCTLAAARGPVASATRWVAILAGITMAALVAIACCAVLMFNAQPPHGLTLPISVSAGVATTLSLRATNARSLGH